MQRSACGADAQCSQPYHAFSVHICSILLSIAAMCQLCQLCQLCHVHCNFPSESPLPSLIAQPTFHWQWHCSVSLIHWIGWKVGVFGIGWQCNISEDKIAAGFDLSILSSSYFWFIFEWSSPTGQTLVNVWAAWLDGYKIHNLQLPKIQIQIHTIKYTQFAIAQVHRPEVRQSERECELASCNTLGHDALARWNNPRIVELLWHSL